jgi:hypothetical protein
MKRNQKPPVNISHNTFTGVHWDKEATEAVNLVAEALLVNAKALSNLTVLFHAQNVTVEAMLKVNSED